MEVKVHGILVLRGKSEGSKRIKGRTKRRKVLKLGKEKGEKIRLKEREVERK